MITVKQVFERAYGQIPDGATCNLWVFCSDGEPLDSGASFQCADGIKVPNRLGDAWNQHFWKRFPSQYFKSPDISDRPAESFRGFFGTEYEDALDALIAEVKS